MAAEQTPLGVVLAGGAGRRLGGDKATARLGGRPLASWVADALAGAVGEVVVVARADSALVLGEVACAVWREDGDGPRHPLFGIAWALEHAGGRPVLVCAVDLPFVDAETLRAVRDGPAGAAVVVAAGQPLLGRYAPSVAPALRAAAVAGASTRATVAALGAVEVAVTDASLFNINSAVDLRIAEALVARGSRAGGPPRPQ